MRALCGAIITAGACIGLGLSALGIGLRYQGYWYQPHPGDHPGYLNYTAPLLVIMFILIAAILAGIGIAVLGLMYHHERRHREWLREQRELTGSGTAGGTVRPTI
jgi:hypothetical protein